MALSSHRVIHTQAHKEEQYIWVSSRYSQSRKQTTNVEGKMYYLRTFCWHNTTVGSTSMNGLFVLISRLSARIS